MKKGMKMPLPLPYEQQRTHAVLPFRALHAVEEIIDKNIPVQIGFTEEGCPNVGCRCSFRVKNGSLIPVTSAL